MFGLQRAAFKLFPDLRSFALSNVAGVDTREALVKHFGGTEVDNPFLGKDRSISTEMHHALLSYHTASRHCMR